MRGSVGSIISSYFAPLPINISLQPNNNPNSFFFFCNKSDNPSNIIRNPKCKFSLWIIILYQLLIFFSIAESFQIRRNVKRVRLLQRNKKSPLERGAALAAGCVTTLTLLVSIPFYYFPAIFLLIFARNTPRYYRATPLKGLSI